MRFLFWLHDNTYITYLHFRVSLGLNNVNNILHSLLHSLLESYKYIIIYIYIVTTVTMLVKANTEQVVAVHVEVG